MLGTCLKVVILILRGNIFKLNKSVHYVTEYTRIEVHKGI